MDYYPNKMQKDEEVRWLIDSAAKAHFNMIRIWGGGTYMTDYFYQYADEIGMMIWEDMMFSCKFYPGFNEEFVANSVLEVREQTGRIQHHPSIVYWVLNNEGLQMFNWGGVRNSTIAHAEYNKLFIENI